MKKSSPKVIDVTVQFKDEEVKLIGLAASRTNSSTSNWIRTVCLKHTEEILGINRKKAASASLSPNNSPKWVLNHGFVAPSKEEIIDVIRKYGNGAARRDIAAPFRKRFKLGCLAFISTRLHILRKTKDVIMVGATRGAVWKSAKLTAMKDIFYEFRF